MCPQHQKVLLWTCSWRASLLTASESPGRSVTNFTLPSLLCFMADSTQLLLKVWLLPSLAPKSRSHKRGPPQLHHQLQGVRPHRQTVQTVAPPERQRHPGGGERRCEQPQALHQIWCAGPGKDKRRSGTCFHGAALLHPGWGWVSRIQLKDWVHFTSYKGVVFVPLLVLSSHNFRSCSHVDTRNRTFRPPGNNGNRSTCDCCHSVGRQQPDHQDDLGSGGARLSSGFEEIKSVFLIKSSFRLLHRSVVPEPPVVKLMEVKDNTFSLVWTPGLEGDSPITGFILEYKAVNGETFISASTCETFIFEPFTFPFPTQPPGIPQRQLWSLALIRQTPPF